VPFTLTCKLCGNEFTAVTRRRKYCNGACFREMERRYSRQARASWSPERKRASVLVQTALYHGRLVRKPCEVCSKKNALAHHDDYFKPLDVRWLCRSHHALHHAALRKAFAL
jgi:hypothetical protein